MTNTVVDNETFVITSVHVQITSVPFILLLVGVIISLDTSGRLLAGETLEKSKEMVWTTLGFIRSGRLFTNRPGGVIVVPFSDMRKSQS